jgi:CIC family chloride channel protein
MTPPPESLRADASVVAAANRFASTRDTALPVTDSEGRYLGTLAAHDVMDALAAGEESDLTALTREVEPLPPDATIGQLLKLLDQGADGVPIAGSSGIVIGWVRHQDVLAALIAPDEQAAPAVIRIATPKPFAASPR